MCPSASCNFIQDCLRAGFPHFSHVLFVAMAMPAPLSSIAMCLQLLSSMGRVVLASSPSLYCPTLLIGTGSLLGLHDVVVEEAAHSMNERSIPICFRHFPTSFQSSGPAFNNSAKGNVHLIGVARSSMRFLTSRSLGGWCY